MLHQNLRLNIGRFFCIPLTVSVLLSSTLYLPSTALSHYNHRRPMTSPAQSLSQSHSPLPPPVAKKVEHVMELFNDTRIDNYYWLRDDSRSDPDVLSYLRQENAYTDSVMSAKQDKHKHIVMIRTHRFHADYGSEGRILREWRRSARIHGGDDVAADGRGTKEIEDKLFAEIRGRIKEEDVSAPLRKGPYYYYTKNLEGKEYVQHCRRLISDNQKVPSVNDTMPTGPDAPPEHVILDENIKAQQHGYYSIGTFKVSPNSKLVAYAEDTKGDEIYTVYVMDVETQAPVGEPIVGVTSYLQWAGDNALVYITMDSILRPYKAWLHVLGTEQSKDTLLYEEKDDTFSLDLDASESKKYLFVASESKNTRFNFYLDVSKPEEGLKVLTQRVDGIDTTVSHRGDHFFIKRRSDQFFNSEVVACAVNNTSSTTVLIPHRESSLKTPPSVYDYDMKAGISVLKKIDSVLGGFDATKYVTERQWARALDGTLIPMSLVYRKDLVKLDGSDPLLLYGYGSYEICIDPSFKSSRLSLLDRGFIYVIAHIRGGGEMGRQWYENGKLLKKKNTFTDFIACAEHLIEKKFCSKERLCINGRSAGGLLIGGVLNMRPDLFKSAVAGVPFVDVVTTMLDPTIPLTTSEWEEWGDPRKEEFYFYMKSYSPVDNVKAQNYPHILVTAGLNDPRVLYSEPAKFVAKLRDLKTDDNILLFKCELGAGHFSKSGRFEKLQEDAFTYTFFLKTLNLTDHL
ncbi:protease 2-like protein [Trifolium pratense]|uniref:Prolyl endopeptidase n=1 Tax=Trifolium pratense TaxID=57577 RepID=A0A2K3NNK6_TRIPR|nr:protease 2-like protein [Trifolium pratense]